MSLTTDRLAPGSLRAASARSFGPWSPEHAVGVLVGNLVGLVLIVVGWWVSERQATPGAQLGWLNVSVAGLGVAAAANGLWLFRGRRAMSLALGFVFGRVDDGDTPADGASPTASAPVALDGGSRFHRPGCELIADKPVITASTTAHEHVGRRPCEVCEP